MDPDGADSQRYDNQGAGSNLLKIRVDSQYIQHVGDKSPGDGDGYGGSAYPAGEERFGNKLDGSWNVVVPPNELVQKWRGVDLSCALE